MRQIYLEYKNYPDLQRIAGEIPWGQNIEIISKTKNMQERIYYAKRVKEEGWTRPTLIMQIQTNAYERHLSIDKQHNFIKTLPGHLATQANNTMKDIYMLDTLGLTPPVLEAEIENRWYQK